MDSKEVRGLMEAYSEVYASPEKLDEISQKLKTRAFKDRATREFESDGDNPKDFTKSGESKANKTKANIVKKHGARAGQHAERAAHAGIFGRKSVLSMPPVKEDFELWVNSLVEEGYNLSNYTWDEMYEFYLDEAITSEKGKAKAAEMIAARTTASGRAKSGKGANVAQIKHIGRSEREGLRGTPMTPTMAKNPAKSRTFSGTGNKAARRAGTYQEGFDIYDVILSHLIDEGYAETVESAEAIMVNMSEDWRHSIIEESIDIITELTGGKGHPGHKVGTAGQMQDGHPADTFKRRLKGGTMSMRHGDHLGDLDDDDDDEDDFEATLKDTARKRREDVRKPLRDKVRAASRKLSKG